MIDRIFVDTNVPVYAFDAHEPNIQERAQSILKQGIRDDGLAFSTQVLSEFFVILTRKIKNPLPAADVSQIIKNFAIVPVVELDRLMVHRAIDTSIHYNLSYWDALILSAAERIGCTRIFTEDLNNG
jgi:predicted nucleic acid-binding protein